MTAYEKLAQVHAAIRQPVKDSVNPHFNSSFASLNECNRVVSEAVRQVGDCDYWQRAAFNNDAGSWEMQTVFCADNTEIVLSAHPFFSDVNPQKAASASTYARRYSLVSAFNLAAEDDDGNRAAETKTVGNYKRRLWGVIQEYAEIKGINATEEANKVLGDKNWKDTPEDYEAAIQKYIRYLNG